MITKTEDRHAKVVEKVTKVVDKRKAWKRRRTTK